MGIKKKIIESLIVIDDDGNVGHPICYTNELGALGHPYFSQGGVEMGDAASWNGHYNYFSPQKDGVPYRKTFEVAFGGYVRYSIPHPIFNKYGSYYKNAFNGNISRDQIQGVIMGLKADNDFIGKIRFVLHTASRLFLLAYNNKQNGVDPNVGPWRKPDFLGPSTWASIIRLFTPLAWLLWVPLHVLDLQILIDTFIINSSEEEGGINYLSRLHMARTTAPTFTSWLCVKLLNKEVLKESIKKYWCGDKFQNGMYHIHASAIDRLE